MQRYVLLLVYYHLEQVVVADFWVEYLVPWFR